VKEMVGYKDPPKQHQFQKGQSGNPQGGRKKAEIEDIRVVMQDVLDEMVKINEGGKERLISRKKRL
jgi:hypothetical protein